MNETRKSLLFRVQTGEKNAWKDLADLYRPLIIGWLNRQGVPASDLEDLSQEVLISVVKHLPGFQHSGNRGAFRSWLRTIVCSRTADYWRALDAATLANGGSSATAPFPRGNGRSRTNRTHSTAALSASVSAAVWAESGVEIAHWLLLQKRISGARMTPAKLAPSWNEPSEVAPSPK